MKAPNSLFLLAGLFTSTSFAQLNDVAIDTDFTNDLTTVIMANNGGQHEHDAINKEFVIISNDIRQGIQLSAAGVNAAIQPGRDYTIQLEIASITPGARFLIRDFWTGRATHGGTLRTPAERSFSSPGIAAFNFKAAYKWNGNDAAESPLLLVDNTGAGGEAEVRLKWLRIFPSASSNENAPHVVIGASAQAADRSVSVGAGISNPANAFRSVTVGDNAINEQPRSVVIGNEAIAYVTDTYRNNTGGPAVSIGYRAESHSWRGVAVGPYAIAGATSSTAIGPNAVAMKSHDTALGRGAYVPGVELTTMPNAERKKIKNVFGGSSHTNTSTYFNNRWASLFDPLPFNDIGIAGVNNPSLIEDEFHLGMDGFDARANATETDIPGGHAGIFAGASSGEGRPGELRFYRGLRGPAGSGAKNGFEEALIIGTDVIDPVEELPISIMWDGKMRQIKVGPSGSGPLPGTRAIFIED